LRDPFIAVDAATDLRAHARVLRTAWESSLGDALGRTGVRPVIAQSWRRLTGLGIDPDHLRPRLALPSDALERAREASPLAEVMPVLRACLQRFAEDAEHMMVVVDGEGRVLWLEGHLRVRHGADGITFGEGMLWTEQSAGTNAIGTALAIDHAVQIFSAEHFLHEQHAWWCSAAPIHDPRTGAIVGVVDLSGPIRSAHPHSLALVMAAAQMAESVLHASVEREDDGLRQRYLSRFGGPGGEPSALVAPDGRVLLAQPAGWVGDRVDSPAGSGLVDAVGHELSAEPLEDGAGAWVLRAQGPRRAPARPGRLRLSLLGPGPPTVQLGDDPPIVLSLRHAEVLLLLLRHRTGLSADALTCELYGDRGKVVTSRAEMSRLRKLLGPNLEARPYRLTGDIDADVQRVPELLVAGRFREALSTYTRRLLPGSEVPAVVDLRLDLEGALQRAARAGGTEERWAWIESEAGADDPFAMAAFIRELPVEDPRRGLVAARLRTLQLRAGAVRAPAAAGVGAG
jgi:hypothetical protein